MITLAGPGVMYGTRTDASGTTACNFGKLKSATLDISFSTKGLTGQSQFPIDFARGTAKATGKLKVAAWSPLAFMNLFWGVSSATGGTLLQFLEAGAIPATPGPYTYSVANAASFVATQEVLYAATSEPLTQVPSAPAAGQYSVAAGVFTFAAADQGKGVLISYTYTVLTGNKLVITSQLQGFTPTFSACFYNMKNGKPVTITLPFMTCEKLNRDLKEDDFSTPEFDVQIGADATGTVMTESYSELS